GSALSARLEAERADPGTDEDVRHRIPIADGKHGPAIPLVEQPHRGGPRRLHPQHSPSLQCFPGGTIPPRPPPLLGGPIPPHPPCGCLRPPHPLPPPAGAPPPPP